MSRGELEALREELERERNLRLAAEARLAETQVAEEMAFESAAVDRWDYDIPGDRFSLSRRSAAHLGYHLRRNSLHLESFLAFVHPEDQGKFRRAIAALPAGKDRVDLEFRMLAKDGSTVWIHSRGMVSSRAPGGKPLTVSGISIDVTERKLLEIACIESEEQFRMLFENMSVAIAVHEMIWDEAGEPLDYRYVSMNEAFEKAIGMKAADCVGKTLLELMPGTEKTWIERYGRVARTGESQRFREHAAVLGKYFDVYAFSPAPNRFATIALDITESVNSRFELERNVARQQLLVQELFHRTRNNLQIVCGILYMKAHATDDPEQIRFYDSMEKRIYSIALVHKILIEGRDLSRVGMESYVSNLAASIRADRPWLSPSSIVLRVEKGLELGFDQALACGQVLFEAIMNAVEHGLDRRADGRVEIGIRSSGGEVELRVEDDGPGTGDRPEGMPTRGIGLFLIEQLGIQQLRGKVDFGGPPGFSVTLRFPREADSSRIPREQEQ